MFLCMVLELSILGLALSLRYTFYLWVTRISFHIWVKIGYGVVLREYKVAHL